MGAASNSAVSLFIMSVLILDKPQVLLIANFSFDK
jgi:hypothetical protein